jgi:lipoyl(octanoyl) transferase
MTIKWSYLGLTPYERALALQTELREQVLGGAAHDYLLLLNHPSVVTRGVSDRGTDGLLEPRERFAAENIPIYDIDRGGKTTYHGPDQLVGYLVFDLKRRELKTRQFVERVAEVIVAVLDSYGIDALYDDDDPGVVVANRKIAFLGFSVKKNVTMHGFGLNVGRDLKPFDYIVPCGKVGRRITSMEDETNRAISMYDLYWRFVTAFGEHFSDTLEEVFVDAETMM